MHASIYYVGDMNRSLLPGDAVFALAVGAWACAAYACTHLVDGSPELLLVCHGMWCFAAVCILLALETKTKVPGVGHRARAQSCGRELCISVMRDRFVHRQE